MHSIRQFIYANLFYAQRPECPIDGVTRAPFFVNSGGRQKQTVAFGTTETALYSVRLSLILVTTRDKLDDDEKNRNTDSECLQKWNKRWRIFFLFSFLFCE